MPVYLCPLALCHAHRRKKGVAHGLGRASHPYFSGPSLPLLGDLPGENRGAGLPPVSEESRLEVLVQQTVQFSEP